MDGGEELRVDDENDRTEVEVAATPVRLVKKGRGLVAVPERELPPLTDDIVRATLDRTRR